MEATSDAHLSTSAVVLNLNGAQLVLECIQSLVSQVPAPLEVICVDNGSSDGSDLALQKRFPGVKLLRLGSNTGFAAGMNRGIAAASGEFVALINLDVVLEPNYLAECVAPMAADPRLGGVMGKLLRPGDTEPRILDTTGHIVYRNRRAVDRGEREPDTGQYDRAEAMFSICGAAPCYRRAMLEDVAIDGQYFDEDFFAYFEDFDLSWRAQLRGWHFAYAPTAVGRHYRGATGGSASTFIMACKHRNRLLVMLRNDRPVGFLRHFADIAYTELRATLHMLGARPAALPAAWIGLFKLLPIQLGRRRQIQSGRTVGWDELEAWFKPYDYRISALRRRARERAAIR
jgi:GT2 family glycosyltransferase